MPKSFFGKLNHLVKSHINDIVSPIDEQTSRSRRKALSRIDIRRGLQGDVKTLRGRIDDALAYQDELQAKINKLYQEVAEWDEKADVAVKEGREQDARNAITRMQQVQRELAMQEADLEEHRYITQELMSQVNMLEGVVEESEQQADEVPETADDQSTADEIGEQIVKQLDSTRKKLSDLISTYTTKVAEEMPGKKRHFVAGSEAAEDTERPERPAHPVDRRKVDDDFESRLARLSKPEKDELK